jgi:hypothetical protein
MSNPPYTAAAASSWVVAKTAHRKDRAWTHGSLAVLRSGKVVSLWFACGSALSRDRLRRGEYRKTTQRMFASLSPCTLCGCRRAASTRRQLGRLSVA